MPNCRIHPDHYGEFRTVEPALSIPNDTWVPLDVHQLRRAFDPSECSVRRDCGRARSPR